MQVGTIQTFISLLVDGIFMEWTDWSECSLTCGGGINVRSRECDGPFYDGLNCTGDWDESRDCNIFNCPSK